MKTFPLIAAVVLMAASGLALHVAQAQQPMTRRVDLQRHDLSTPGREVLQSRVEFPPGVAFPRHRHPGEEVIYVLQGEIEYQVEDGPPVTLRVGDVLFVPDGAIHSARNVGKGPAAELATFLVKKGEPLAQIVD